MNILIAVHDLTSEKWHLMPWRTVVEVVKGLREMGHRAILFSLDGNENNNKIRFKSEYLPDGTFSISKRKQKLPTELMRAIQTNETDILFWPITWREPRWRTRALAALDVKIVGWFPGGVYEFLDVLYALRKMGLGKTLPYLVEALYPKRLQLQYMNNKGVDTLLTMTKRTAIQAISCGWPENRIFTVPPGKDYIDKHTDDIDCEVMDWLKDRPFLLFMGPPSTIRGINEVLAAFNIAARQSADMCLVCLFRDDGYLDRDSIAAYIKQLDCRNRIYTVWDSLPKSKLNGYMRACHAAVLPFKLVPSEIPLAIIETIAHAKPVMTTNCGGTGEFVAGFGTTTPVGDIKALAAAMLRLVNDEAFYAQCCRAAEMTYDNYPDWETVSEQWGIIAEKTLVTNSSTSN